MSATLRLNLLPPIAASLAAALVALLALLAAAPMARASVPNYKGSSADGSVVFFESDERLVPGDTDFMRDVYERSFDPAVDAYVTREVSLGPTGGNDAYPAQFEAASEDGTLVFFSSQERLVAEDTDRSTDVYMRNLETGATTLVTKGDSSCAPGCGNGEFPVIFADATGDGTKVFFETKERLVPEDTDSSTDLYMRNLETGETVLVSAGESACLPGCGNGEFDVSRRGISSDGRYAYFSTEEPLSSADMDSARDIYARDLQEGETYLVSRGQCSGCGNSGVEPIFDGSSADGSRVFFSTAEKLVEGDNDEATDVYARELPAGPTTLISKGTKKTTASYSAAPADGAHVFFTSAEGLVAEDEDNANDVYEWSEGAPSLKLVTSAECTKLCGATFEALSENAEEVVFTTAEALVPEDRDESDDIYRQNVNGGEPVLVSRGEDSCTSCWSGEQNARFNEASADASRVVFSTAEGILEGDDDGEDDIYLRDTNGAGSTSLITIAPSYCPLKPGNCGATFVGASADGEHVFFRSVERFTLEDGDNEADIYERDLSSPGNEVTRLVSTENDPKLDLGPEPPQLLETSPESPGQSTAPRLIGEAQAGAKVKVYTSADCSGEPVATGTAEELLEPGLQVTVAASSLTSFRATAEAEGFVSTCSAPLSYEEVTPIGSGEEGGGGGSGGGSGGASSGATTKKAGAGGSPAPKGPTYLIPHTRITYGPGAKTRRHKVVFRFTDSTGQPGTTFSCKLDRKRWKACSSPLRLKRLGRGRHVLQVQATNAVGEQEPTVAKRAFKVVPR